MKQTNKLNYKEIIETNNNTRILLSYTFDETKQTIIETIEYDLKVKLIFKDNYFTIPLKSFENKIFYLNEHSSNHSSKNIQGLTIDYWYKFNDGEINKEFEIMSLSRLSFQHSKIYQVNHYSKFHRGL